MGTIENATTFIVMLLIGILFIGIGLYCLMKSSPIHFWSMSTVKSEEITDVKSYNKEHAIMWIIWGSAYIVSAIFALFESILAPIIVVLASTVGGVIAIIFHLRIYKKYKLK